MYSVRTGTYWYATRKVCTFSLKYVLLSWILYSVRTKYIRFWEVRTCIWNPYEVYSRNMPGIFHVCVGPQYIHGIYYVYAKYIRILVLCISWSFNVVNPCHGWGQSNVEDITFQHSMILRDSNATLFHGIYLTYTCIYLVYARHIPFWVIFNFGTLTGTLWKLEELEIHAHSMVAQDNNSNVHKRYVSLTARIYVVYNMYITCI
jgi:hypothetical protein